MSLPLEKAASFELKKIESTLLEQNLTLEIKNGLRNKKSARHEMTTILVKLIKFFKEKIAGSKDVAMLMDDEDIEKDFYEKIKHIQVSPLARPLWDKLSEPSHSR